jgi:DHA2 family multidrug resistance protein
VSLNQIPGALDQQAGAVLQMLDAEVSRQAATIAYVNDFRLMMWIVLAAAPLVLLLRKEKPAPEATATAT